MDKASVQLSSV